MEPEMRYAVAICPVCKQAFGMEEKVAKVTCPRCMKAFPGDMPRRAARVDEPGLLQEAVARVNASIKGSSGDDGFSTLGEGWGEGPGGSTGGGGNSHDEADGSSNDCPERTTASSDSEPSRRSGGRMPDDPVEWAAYRASSVRGQREKALAIAEALTLSLGDFDGGHFARACRGALLDGDPGKWLERMRDGGELAEPTPGRYRYIGA